jgi:hypothetical protein
MFAWIPPELIELVYDYIDLNLECDLRWHYSLPLLQLNRHWRATLLPKYWRKLELMNIKRIDKYQLFLLRGLEVIGNVVSLSLKSPEPNWDRKNLRMAILHQISPQCKVFELSKMNICLMSFPFDNITRIVLDTVVFDDSICYEYLLLKELFLINCRCVNDSMLLFLLALNLQITTLAVVNCPITNDSIPVINKLKLNYIDLSGTLITVDYIHVLGEQSEIRYLGLARMQFTMRQTDFLTDALTQFKFLERLDVRGTTCALNALLNMEHFGLLELKFGTNAFLQDSSLRSLLTKYPSLLSIEFSDELPLSDMALFHLIQRLKQLERLSLPRQNTSPQLHLVTSATLLRIPTYLPNLKYFEAIGYHFNHEVLLEFARHCQNLEYLFIGNSRKSFPFITEATIAVLLQKLKKLKKIGCQGLGLNPNVLKRLQKEYWGTMIIY